MVPKHFVKSGDKSYHALEKNKKKENGPNNCQTWTKPPTIWKLVRGTWILGVLNFLLLGHILCFVGQFSIGKTVPKIDQKQQNIGVDGRERGHTKGIYSRKDGSFGCLLEDSFTWSQHSHFCFFAVISFQKVFFYERAKQICLHAFKGPGSKENLDSLENIFIFFGGCFLGPCLGKFPMVLGNFNGRFRFLFVFQFSNHLDLLQKSFHVVRIAGALDSFFSRQISPRHHQQIRHVRFQARDRISQNCST